MKNNLSKLTSLLLCIIITISSISFVSCSGADAPLATSEAEKETTASVETTAVAPTDADPETSPSPETPLISETEERSETEKKSETKRPKPSTKAPSVESSPSDNDTRPSETESSPDVPCNSTVISPTETAHTPPTSSQTETATETQLKPTESTPSVSTNDAPVSPSVPEVNDFSFAATQGLRSAVSVYCLFNGGTSASAGSGVIYKLDGESGSAFIITNFHVVYNSASQTANKISDDIHIFLFGLEYAEYIIPVTYVGGSPNYDIAILYVENSEIIKNCYASGSIKPITVANSDELTAGQTAIAVGNPEADGISVTEGIISVDSEQITMNAINGLGTVDMRVIRIDTAVNSGNSGGGLFNAKGELIGIVNAKIKSEGVESIGYAIPSNIARAIADNIIDYCYGKPCETVMRGMLGVTITIDSISTSYDEEKQAIIVTQTVKVHEVVAGGLADGILKSDDLIVSLAINGRTVTVTRQHHLIDAMLDVRVGDKVEITVIRNGREITVSTIITEDCLVAY